MNNPSLIGIHGLQINRSSGLFHFVSDVSCQIFQCFFSAFAVVLRIKFDTNVILLLFVDHKAGQILKGIQCLSAFSDQDTHILTGEINFQRTVLGIILHLDLNRELHGFEYTA